MIWQQRDLHKLLEAINGGESIITASHYALGRKFSPSDCANKLRQLELKEWSDTDDAKLLTHAGEASCRMLRPIQAMRDRLIYLKNRDVKPAALCDDVIIGHEEIKEKLMDLFKSKFGDHILIFGEAKSGKKSILKTTAEEAGIKIYNSSLGNEETKYIIAVDKVENCALETLLMFSRERNSMVVGITSNPMGIRPCLE